MSDGRVPHARNDGASIDHLLDRVVGVPSGTVTFLFTDIEGSTELWEKASDPMRSALARHDAIAVNDRRARWLCSRPAGMGSRPRLRARVMRYGQRLTPRLP